jgi:hypothetical protein
MEIPSSSLVAALLLALTYPIGGRRRAGAGSLWRRRRWVSAAAGVSVAYVFVDVLPELGAQHRAFLKVVGHEVLFAEQRIYALALVAFVTFYGLEHIVLASRERDQGAAETGVGGALYWLRIAGFATYSGLIGYLLVERAERGPVALAVYAFAMALHFLILDHTLAEGHGRFYGWTGRAVLAASVLVGWLLGAWTPLSEMVFARLFAVLAGGVVITTVTAELPGERRGRFWPFFLGAAGYAVLLFLT